MNQSTSMTLLNHMPDLVTVTFQITAGQTTPVKITVPSGGSVQHPTDASDLSWLVSVTVSGVEASDPSNTTKSITLKDPNARVKCLLNQVVGMLRVESSSPASDGAGLALSSPSSSDGDGWQTMDLNALHAAQIPHFHVAHQEQTQWCWAALAASVANFYNGNHGITQCSLASWAFAPANCCDHGGGTPACNRPYSIGGGLARVAHLNATLANGMDMHAIQIEIDAARPIGVRVAWKGGAGAAHAMAIKGYHNQPGHQMIDISDPTYGKSTVAFVGFPGNYHGGGDWTHSYTTH